MFVKLKQGLLESNLSSAVKAEKYSQWLVG